MEVRKKEMSSISREKDDTFKVFKLITNNCLHLHLYSKLLVFIHTYLGHLSLKLCHRVLEIWPVKDRKSTKVFITYWDNIKLRDIVVIVIWSQMFQQKWSLFANEVTFSTWIIFTMETYFIILTVIFSLYLVWTIRDVLVIL